MFGAYQFAESEFAESPGDLPAVITHRIPGLDVSTRGVAVANGAGETALAIGGAIGQVLGNLNQSQPSTSF